VKPVVEIARSFFTRIFDFLSPSEPPVPADAIFVLAGRPERKRYGIELWKRGLAPALILSVARFEWRRFPELGLPDDGGLTRLVQETYYKRRHFFVTLDSGGANARFVPTRFLGTRREALGLAEEVRAKGYRSLLVVSTSVHLRRTRLALKRALGDLPMRVSYTAVPEAQSGVRRDSWFRSVAGWSYVTGELFKLPLYGLLPR
jgi:uncharacterized SAM-binding protein YcdF (DUF218 family)